MKCFIALLILVTIFGIFLSQNSKAIGFTEAGFGQINTTYEYEILPGDPAWDDLDIEERFDISNPSPDICQNYTTSALLTTVLNCPFISSIYAFDSLDEGIDICRSAIYSLDEYMCRSDAIVELNSYIFNATLEHDFTGEDYSLEYYVACRLNEYLIKQNNACPDVFC